MVKKISASEFAQVEGSKAALVDFSATWCGPCKMLAPVLEQVSQELAGKVDFYNVDVDEAQALAVRYGISSIPALILFQNGKAVGQMVGFRPKESIVAFVNEHL